MNDCCELVIEHDFSDETLSVSSHRRPAEGRLVAFAAFPGV